jgi:hypothetical protein
METKQPSGLHRHYAKIAGICVVFGLVVILQLFRETLPSDSAEKAGAITANLFVTGLLFAAGAYFFLKRPRGTLP